MGRYARAVYGAGKYGLDLWTEKSVEPMVASIELDPVFSHISSFTNEWGEADYNRVQISWILPQGVDRFLLLRSNLGFPTGPQDPYSATILDSTGPAPESLSKGARRVSVRRNDAEGRTRLAVVDRGVEPGREAFYAAWTYVASAGEWILSGRAMVTVSADHGTFGALKDAMPAYMWNAHGGPGDGIDVLPDPDTENFMGRWLQACAWQLDKTLTKADGLRRIWDPQYTPAVLLDDATRMFGLPVEPELGARASRALLANAADITGERGSLMATNLLLESLTGYAVDLQVGTNMLGSTNESSFEGMEVAKDGSQTVVGGTGRWYFSNAKLTRIGGDVPTSASGSKVLIARSPNSDDEWIPAANRYGLRLDAANTAKDITLSLGERVRITQLAPGTTNLHGIFTTAWVHGLERGDVVKVTLDGGTTVANVTVLAIEDDFHVRADLSAAVALQGVTRATSDAYFFGGMIPVYQGLPVEPQKAYSLVGKFQAANAKNFGLTITYWDRYGESLGTLTATPSTNVPPAPAWTQAYNSGSSPVGAVSATVAITMLQQNAPQYLAVDSLMLKPGGTPYTGPLPYDSSTPYEGVVDYTFEDARLLTITIDPSKTPARGEVPGGIAADQRTVVEARLTDILTGYLPAGTAFAIRWGVTPE